MAGIFLNASGSLFCGLQSWWLASAGPESGCPFWVLLILFFVAVMTGFVVVVVVCVRFSIFISFSMEYTKHVYTCNFYKNDNLKSF